MVWTDRSAKFSNPGHGLLAVVVALSLVTVPTTAAAAPSLVLDSRAALPEQLPLTVATDGLGDPEMRAPVKTSVERDARPIFSMYESSGHSLEGISVEVTIGEPGEPGIFQIDITGSGPGGVAKQEAVKCEFCTESDLTAKTVEGIAKLLSKLDEGAETAPPPETTEPAEPADEPTGDQTPVSNQDQGEDKKPLGGLGIGGAVLMGVGVGAIVPGAVLAAREDTVETSEIGNVERRTTKPAGFALIATGAAMVVTGAALLAVDRIRAKKGQSPANAMLVPTGTGAAIVGRF